jgi:hypothetical protein
MLSRVLEGDPGLSSGGYLDLRTGQVYDDSAPDPMMVGEDAAMDVEEEPGFAELQRDEALRGRLGRAIAGKGAFVGSATSSTARTSATSGPPSLPTASWAVPASSSLTMASEWAEEPSPASTWHKTANTGPEIAPCDGVYGGGVPLRGLTGSTEGGHHRTRLAVGH